MRALFVALLLSLVPATLAAETNTSAVYVLDADLVGGEAREVEQLAYWAKKGDAKELVIRIDSNGGEMGAAIALYRAIQNAGLPTRCEVNGNAASGAFLVLMACQTRAMTKASHLYTHRPQVMIPRPAVLTVEAARAMVDQLEAGANVFDALIAQRLGLSLAEYRAKVAFGKTWELDADQALKAHAIDQVLP